MRLSSRSRSGAKRLTFSRKAGASNGLIRTSSQPARRQSSRRPSVVTMTTGTVPTTGPAFQRVSDEEHQTARDEPSELGVHVALPEAVNYESDAQGQHRDDLEDFSADVEHRRHYNGWPDPVTTRAASLPSDGRFRYDRPGCCRGAG